MSMSEQSEPTVTLEAALAHASRLLDTDPALAGEQASEIIRTVGQHPMALLLLGASHNARNNPRQALEVLRPLAEAQPGSAHTQLELGIALGRTGQGDAALAALRRAVELKPDLPAAWLALGDQLMATGDTQAADDAYARHVRHSTRDPELLRAASALAGNRIPEAEALLRDRLKKAPTDVAAIRMFAELAARLGRNDEADRLLERCLELAPSFHGARQNYALILHRANKPEQALAQIDRLLTVDAANPGYRNLKAVVLCRIGDYPTAIGLYDELLKQYPRNPKVWMSFGHSLKTAGHAARAIAAYRQSLAIDPAIGEVWWSLANLKTFRFTAQDVVAMQHQLAQPQLPDEDRLHLEFAVGKAREDAAEYASSFEHYARGNAIRRTQ